MAPVNLKYIYNIIWILAALVIVADSLRHGCFKENRRRPLYTRNPGGIQKGSTTPGICNSICGGYAFAFAALRAGEFCFCSNTAPAPTLPLESDGNCTMPCIGDPASTCGSATHVEVYDTIAPIDMLLDAVPEVVAVGQQVSLSVDVDTTNPAYVISMDYDDDAGLTEYVANGTGLMDRTYSMAGDYSVTAFASTPDLALPPSPASKSVRVEAPVGGVTMECAEYMATFEPDMCLIHLNRGTTANVTVTYHDGLALQTTEYAMPEADEHLIGNPVQENLLTPIGSTYSTGIVMHQAWPAEYSGTLVGLEYFAVGTGTFTAYVYRPSCVGGEFCYESNTCVALGGCDSTCGGNLYCADLDTCCSGPPARTAGLIPGITYMSVYNTTVSVTSLGYGFEDLTDAFEVLPGDVLAHEANPQILAIVNMSNTDLEDAFCAGVYSPQSLTDASCVNTLTHQVKGVYAHRATAYLPLLFSVSGNVTFQATANSVGSILGTDYNETIVTVIDGVNASIIVEPLTCVPANESFTFSVEAYTGDEVDLYWHFGNGDIVNTTMTTTAVYTYPTTGTYNMSVNITNPKSEKFNWTMICVEERIVDFSLSTDSYFVEVGVPVNVSLNMASGSHFSCDFTFTYEDATKETTTRTYLEGFYYPHTFLKAGNVTVYANCSNTINSVNFTVEVRAVERLTGVALTPQGAMVGVPFNVLLSWVTGTDVTVTLSYDNVSQTLTMDEINKNVIAPEMLELVTGLHNVDYTISNPLDPNPGITYDFFAIEIAVTNPWVDCTFVSLAMYIGANLEQAVIGKYTDVQCTVGMDDGTSVTIFFDYGDGFNHTEYIGLGVSWAANTVTFPIVHTFNIAQFCGFTVTVSNNFNSQTFNFPVWVMVGVNDVTLNPQPPELFLPPAVVNFDFTVIGDVPNDVTCYIEWGDGNNDLIYPCDVTSTYPHEYLDKNGNLPLFYRLSNHVSMKEDSFTVYIVSPIIDDNCYTVPVAGAPGWPVDFVYKTWRGPGTGLMDLTYDCNTATPLPDLTRSRIYDSPDGEDVLSCTFANKGSFAMTVLASSMLENKTCTYNIQVIDPVLEDYTFAATNAPVDWEISNTCTLNFLLNYFGTPLPENAFIEYDFEDGNTFGPVPFNPSHAHSYTYATHGNYRTTITIYNDASSSTRTILSGCYANILDTAMTVLREPYIPAGGPDTVGFGVGQDNFRTDENMKIHATHTTGTVVYWEVTAENLPTIYACNSTDPSISSLLIDQPGTYTITVTGKNPLYSGPPQTFLAIMMNPVNGTTITDNGIVTNAYVDKFFDITMTSYGSAMCSAAHFNDPMLGNQVQLYGDAVTCNAAITAGFVPNGFFPGAALFYDGSVVTSGPFTIQNQYTIQSAYKLELYSWNTYSDDYASFSFAVSGIDCSAPNINIKERKRNFLYPLLWPRSKRIKTVGITDIACPDTLENTKNWTITLWNETTNQPIADIPIDTVPSAINSELAFEPRFLPYGQYLLNYKVTMLTTGGNGEQFTGQAEHFIKVVPSDLVVQLFENSMSRLSVGPAQVITVSPRQWSYDPDINRTIAADIFDGFELACRDATLNEVFPDSGVTVTALNLTDLPPLHVDVGGCFRTGAGWISGFDGSVTFRTDILKINHTYEFLVKGMKGNRMASTFGQLEVKPANPPEFSINFKIPSICWQGPKGKMFNPNSQLGIVGTIINPCPGCTYSFLWEMFAYDYQFCGNEYKCWRNLAYLGRYIEGTQSEELTIHTEVFSHYHDVDTFQVRLHVTVDQTGASGTTYLNLTRNNPPSDGNCTITNSTGVSGMTSFTIDCQDNGFVDIDGDSIINHKVTCLSGDRLLEVASDDKYWQSKYLPSGDPDNGYILKCNVSVFDERGAVGTYPIHDVVVYPMVMTDMRKLLVDMLDIKDDISDIIDAIANLDETASYANTIQSMLNTLTDDDEFTKYLNMGTAASFVSTRLNDNGTRQGAFDTVIDDPAMLEAYEKVRDAGANLVSNVINTLDKCTIESTEETMRAANSIAALSSNPAFLTRQTQNDMTSLLEMGVKNMFNNIETLTVEDIQNIGQSTLDACSNIEQAAVLAADHPTNTDLETQEEAVPYFSSNMDSTLDDVPIFADDSYALRAGKTIMNKDEQVTFAEENLGRCNNIQEDIVYILASQKPRSNEPTVLVSGSMETAVLKNSAADLQNQTLNAGGCTVRLPENMFPAAPGGADDTLILTMMTKTLPGPPLAENSPMSPYSRELSIGFRFPNGTERRVTNLPTPIELVIKQDPNQPMFNMSMLGLADPTIVATREEEYLFYHSVKVINSYSALQLRFSPTNMTEEHQLLVLINFDEMPTLTADQSKVREVCMIPRHTNLWDFHGDHREYDPYTCFVDADIIGEDVGDWKIGVRQMLPEELNAYPNVASLPLEVPAEWKGNKTFHTNYKLHPVELTCAYTLSGSSVIRRDGVKPNPFSSESEIRCNTTHLTTFAGGWVVAPNTIDWNFVFANADFLSNPTLYVTQIVVLVVYVVAMIWARRKDKQDVNKLGLAPLMDNDPKDKYYYEILVSTGMRRGAGTDSKVHFILSGEEEETEVRTFTDSKRKIFQRSSNCGFLMAVRENIGPLTYLRIWHDNSGKGRFASWYLNHVVIRDVQTDKKYYFIANKWFAVEEDDGQVDRVIPVAGKEQMTEFSHLFAERATKNLSDGHLWFSVVARPPQSRFTRCQRVSCCLCLLYTSMLANAMFYNTANSDNNAFQFGPFAITSEQIFIGVAANLIIFPINFLLVTIFRKSRPRKLRPSRVEEALKSMPERSTSMADVNMRVKSSMDHERPGSSFLMDVKRAPSSMSTETGAQADSEKKKKKKSCELPWWFLIIGWILLYAAVIVSAAFVIFYGISFQDIKCKKWITSMLVSFVTSIFLTQPIKVFLFAILFSLIIKNPGGDEDEEDQDEEAERKKLASDEELLHDDEEDEFGIVSPRKPLYKPKPLDHKALAEARAKRLKEIQMWQIIREIMFYAFFLWILLVISYRSVSTNSYNYKKNMQNVFIITNNTNQSFSKIHNTEDFWRWAKSGMLRGLRAGPYYNNFPPFYMRGYINDKQSRLMGYAVLRQVRMEPDTCMVPKAMENVIPECNSGYDISQEQSRDFGPGWNSSVSSTREEYHFQEASSLNGFPYWGEMAFYGGGGYVVKLNKDYFDMINQLDQLQSEGWIDRYTRAVFLEFTVYNPSINLFSISTLLSEFRPSGGVFTSYRFEPCNLLPYMSSALLFQIICEIIYILFTLFFVILFLRTLYKERCGYFKQFWNLIDLGICAMSVTAVVIYFYRLVCINDLTEYFKTTHGNEYMKFQYVGYWSEIFNYIIGFLVYFATLKFLKLLRFNRKISLLADTLNNSSRDLIHFSIIFNIVFMAFIQLFYLIFGKHLDIFKTVTSSCEAGIVMMMGKFDIYNMLGVNQWLTQIFLFLFVVSVTFIVVNMLVSILNDTFTAVRNDKNKQKNDYEIIDFMLSRFKMWTGLGRDNTTISPADMEKERNKQYQDLENQIDHFPDQIDRFLASVSNMYMGDAKFDNFLQKGMAKKMAEKASMAQAPSYDPATGGFHPAPRMPGAQRISSGARGMTSVETH